MTTLTKQHLAYEARLHKQIRERRWYWMALTLALGCILAYLWQVNRIPCYSLSGAASVHANSVHAEQYINCKG